MLESVFIIIMAMGFVLFVLAVYEESIVFSATSMLMWVIVMAGHIAIEVPTDTFYYEPGMLAVSLAFIFLNVILTIKNYMDFARKRVIP